VKRVKGKLKSRLLFDLFSFFIYQIFLNISIKLFLNRMRILVTGSSGLLGSKVVEKLSKIYEVIPTYATKKMYENSVKLDICFPNEVKEIF